MSGIWLGGMPLATPFTWTGMQTFAASPTSATFTGVPTGTTATTSTLVVNPASATANADLAWFGLNGTRKFDVDEDGDGDFAGSLTCAGYSFQTAFSYARISTGENNGFVTWGSDVPAQERVRFGFGAYRAIAGGQVTLGAHLDQDDVTIHRDVDLDGTYNEAGSLLHLWRDVTNGGTIAGNFLEWSNDGATPLGYIDTTGGVVAPTFLAGDITLGDTANDYGHAPSEPSIFIHSTLDPDTDDGEYAALTYDGIRQGTMETDRATYDFAIEGSIASAAATTNKVGGNIDIVGGFGDGAAGQTAAHGGRIDIHGGSAASDLDSSDGGDVVIYGGTLGTNGVPGSDGAVIIADADGSTPVVKVLNGVTQIGAPDGANHLDVAADGTLTLNGAARVSTHVDFDNAALGKGATAPAQVVLGTFNGWEYDIGDDSHLNFVLPHNWDTSSDITVTIRWYVDEAYAAGGNNGEVQWRCAWSACPADNTEAVDAPTHTGTNDTADINIPATAKFLIETTVVTIPAASLADQDSIGLDIERVALDGGNDPAAAKPTIINIHVMYTADKLGN